MTITTTTEELTTLKKLVKINGDLKDFAADVNVKSVDGKNFMFQFFSQTDLDNSNKLQYDMGNNISTSFKVTDKPYESYYVMLKSTDDEPVVVQVTIDLKLAKGDSKSNTQKRINVDTGDDTCKV